MTVDEAVKKLRDNADERLQYTLNQITGTVESVGD